LKFTELVIITNPLKPLKKTLLPLKKIFSDGRDA